MGNDVSNLFSLEGKTALVAGASRGIGEEIARIFAAAGAKVAMSSRRKEGVEEAAARVAESTGGEVMAEASNISSREDCESMVKKTLDWGGSLDVLVCNAGTNPAFGPLEDVEESAWDKIWDVNLKGPFVLSQIAFHAWMKENGGSIIHTASVGGLSTTTGTNVYNVTKAALIHLTKAQASEWGKHGIRVNALAPGLIKTRLSQALWDGPDGGEAVGARYPAGRLGEVQDLAGATLLLASDAGAFITGIAMVVDGGGLIA